MNNEKEGMSIKTKHQNGRKYDYIDLTVGIHLLQGLETFHIFQVNKIRLSNWRVDLKITSLLKVS